MFLSSADLQRLVLHVDAGKPGTSSFWKLIPLLHDPTLLISEYFILISLVSEAPESPRGVAELLTNQLPHLFRLAGT